MMTKSPSEALSPYYYKGGYFHGIHYGSYFGNAEALEDMMKREEEFILKSCEKRRIMIDLYETELSPRVLEALEQHLIHLCPKIVKLAFATDRKGLRVIRKMIRRCRQLENLCCYYSTDMEEGKTWLVSDSDNRGRIYGLF